tara:strand:+ start:280 stop:471 length:192 start_codon:yes stop_codon:yes gene_type:complete
MTRAFEKAEELVFSVNDRPLTSAEVNQIESLKPQMSRQEREMDLLFLMETVDVPEFYEDNGST